VSELDRWLVVGIPDASRGLVDRVTGEPYPMPDRPPLRAPVKDPEPSGPRKRESITLNGQRPKDSR
jgi:hypothetical protein